MKNITPTRVLLGAFFVFIGGYAVYQSSQMMIGPKINLRSPTDGATEGQALVSVEGQARRIAYLTLDDNPIFTDEAGNFKEKLLLAPGYNIIKLHAEDRFRRVIERRLQIMYQ
ncbi:MAG: hypothetical protein HYT48_03115 [Candidatus Vogelbacteria bacterium]|nr:hypothetical protein [Candidatus Vogelbacteria bacterium]